MGIVVSSYHFVSGIPSFSLSFPAPSVLGRGNSLRPTPVLAVGCVWPQKESILCVRVCAAFEEGRRNIRGTVPSSSGASYCLDP